MPFTFNGCGTRYYGRRDRGPDGSFVTTEWITFVYLPLFPIRSMSVLPQGKSTNLVIYHSQEFQSGRVPLSWVQIRNVYLIMFPIFAVILYFSWGDLRSWAVKTWSSTQPIKMSSAPPDAPVNVSSLACGSSLKLEGPAFERFHILERIPEVVKQSEFTPEELKDVSSEKELEDDAFGAYSLGYLTWNKPVDPTRNDLGQKFITTINTVSAKASAADAASVKDYGRKDLKMLLNAFDMGRHDGRTSCP
jgi:hypothetical protein